ncbi:aminoacyl-histidine dipeptidase [Vibrio rumoiensis]|uniref:Cytosol non-specific dipeptidase n=1 Tax=Vibrio rumoiensis 1S-45 TaxID=1188252 RepID=A0A1E5E3C6_9VIBR|nr:aminoacyl-histidine dipeptidase [Vibrio rumoiensis]OEF26290.1 cytosol nonspecific dipeptidase [Vibrio rumoiensis 1S-45]
MSEFHSEISQLSPQPVWQFFDKICSFPHPSKHEEALAQYIVDWAKSQNLPVKRDEIGNVFITKPATAGMENKKKVVLQAHIDMVPQKNEDTDHDFAKDPIQPYIDGEWVTAKGTTLGADNGMGMASCLAVLASTDIKHGPLEVLLTIDEEAGMTGAFELKEGWLEADILLNTDSEQEGEIYMGCAGGVNASIIFDIERETIPASHTIQKLSVKGLKGGHSGCDIHTGRGNANKFLARFLANHAKSLGLRVIEFQGGSLRNAIPREASVILAVPSEQRQQLEAAYQEYTALVQQELGKIETGLTSLIADGTSPFSALTLSIQQRFIAALNACPNGVIRMDDNIEGVVETSLNVGVITTEENKITILCLVRSLIDSGREMVEGTLVSLADLAGAQVEFDGAYPGWKPDPDSEIMHIFRDVYEGIYGQKPNIMVIHAGLECGLFKKPYPNMDMISFGPTIKFPHSPDEKVLIESVGLYWEQMIAILENIPEKV